METDPDRIDFGALDPAADRQRWEALVQRTLRGGGRPAMPPVSPLLLNLVSTGRLALAAALALAVLAWVPALMSQPTDSASTDDAVAQWSTWAAGGALPRTVSASLSTGAPSP